MGEDKSMIGQVAIVTGGGGGIGSAICRRLARAGAQVIVLDLNLENAQTLVETLPGENHMVTDVSIMDSAALKALAVQLTERYGVLDLLVNNAGITTPVTHDDLDGLTDEWIDRIFQVNWRGGFACVRAFKDLLQAGNGGTVVNISSIAGTTGIGSNVAYCASKAAIELHDPIISACAGAGDTGSFCCTRLGPGGIREADGSRLSAGAGRSDAGRQVSHTGGRR